MGATPDVNLAYMVNVNEEGAQTNGCTSPCILVKYTDQFFNGCQTHAEQASITWALANDETALLHIYGGTQTSGNRMVNTNGSSSACASYSGTYPYIFNPGDTAWQSWIYSNVWTNTTSNYYPSGYNVYEDDSNIYGGYVCGIGSSNANYPSGEYSIGWNGGTTSPCNFAGTSGATYGGGASTFMNYVQSVDYQTGVASWINNACQATCLKVGMNGGSELASSTASVSCSIIISSHCHNQFAPQIMDDRYNYDTFLAALTKGNFIGMDTEKPILGQYSGSTYAKPAQLIVLLNTLPSWYAKANCSSEKLMDFEYGFGPVGPGVPLSSSQQTSAIQAQTLITAMHWLIPNPSTLIPDCWIYHLNTIGGALGAANEAPIYFPSTLVPWKPEEAVSQFTWNGTTVTTGGGCDSATANTAGTHGDTGGVIGLLVQCVNSGGGSNDGAGIYCQQYQHLYINGTDKGKAAACVDTSASQNPTIASSWFTNDSWTNYQHQLSLTPWELTSIPLAGAGGTVSLPSCTSANCAAYPSAGGESTAWSSGSPGTICGSNTPPCGIVLTANAVP